MPYFCFYLLSFRGWLSSISVGVFVVLHCYLAIPAEDRPIDKVLLTFVVIVMVWYRLTSSARRRVERKEGRKEGGREGRREGGKEWE